MLILLITLCTILDIQTTVYGISNGLLIEGNPGAIFMMNTIGLLGWAAIRTLTLLIPLAIAYVMQWIWEISTCNKYYMFCIEMVAFVILFVPNAMCAVNNLIILF